MNHTKVSENSRRRFGVLWRRWTKDHDLEETILLSKDKDSIFLSTERGNTTSVVTRFTRGVARRPRCIKTPDSSGEFRNRSFRNVSGEDQETQRSLTHP